MNDTTETSDGLSAQICRQARLSRDPRFDGEFFLGVRTTGIYCRPICPARAPAEKNVSYYRSAAQAAAAGFRPCLRCRPESAPDSPAWRGASTTVQRALQLIKQGALNEDGLEALADRLGVGERYLRKLFERELGVSPVAVALNQRLLFAKKLLAETDLPMTEVAFAAGFGSVRRFNSAVQAQFRLTPGALRARNSAAQAPAAGIQLQLQYRPPYDWEGVLGFFRRHAVEGVDVVDADSYRRNIVLQGVPVSFRVSRIEGRNALRLDLDLPDPGMLMPAVASVRRMFDLDANPAVILDTLAADPVLAPLLDKYPGIRAPGHWSLYESAVRAIVGQQISIAAARGICGRLAAATSADRQRAVFPAAGALAALDDSHFPMPGRRRDSLRELGRQCCGREEALDLEQLGAIKGVGPWTIGMVAMRGGADPDIFPETDLGLVKAWQSLPGATSRLREHATNWRPWRSYAANLLWRSLPL